MHVHVAGFRVAGHRSPSDSRSRDICLKDVEFVVPKNLTVGDVSAHDLFLSMDQLVAAIAHIMICTTLQVDAAIHDDWSRSSANRRFPKNVRAFLQVPVFH